MKYGLFNIISAIIICMRFDENVPVRTKLLFDKEPMTFLLCNIGKAYDQESPEPESSHGKSFHP